MGLRESMPWFFAYVFFTALIRRVRLPAGRLGVADTATAVSLRTIGDLLCAELHRRLDHRLPAAALSAFEEKRKTQTKLEEAHRAAAESSRIAPNACCSTSCPTRWPRA